MYCEQRSQYISIKFPLHKPSENCGNYSREETIQGRKLFAEIRYLELRPQILFLRYTLGINDVRKLAMNQYVLDRNLAIDNFKTGKSHWKH